MTSAPTKCFSQNREQDFILAHTPEHGRFLDIGSWDPFDKSNVRALYERGWGGVLVEPSPGPFANLQREYEGIPGIVLVNAAVSLTPGPIEMWLTDDAVSTSDEKVHKVWQRVGNYRPKTKVNTVSLERLYRDYGDFDFVSIDAEGTSTEIFFYLLMGLVHRPQCICVEFDERIETILFAARECGYSEVYRSGENVVLVKR